MTIPEEVKEIETHSQDYQDGVKVAIKLAGTKDSVRYGRVALKRSLECYEGYKRGMLLAVKLLESMPQMQSRK